MTYEARLLQFGERDDVVRAVDLTALVEQHGSLLFRVAHSMLRSRPEAEDVVQDTFVRVLEKQHQLSGIQDMRVWLVRITWRLALDRRRRIKPAQMDEAFTRQLAGTSVPADQALSQAQQMARTLAAIDALPGPERQALLLAAQQELATAEVAAVLGRSESATRALLSRARGRLRERMQQAERRGNR